MWFVNGVGAYPNGPWAPFPNGRLSGSVGYDDRSEPCRGRHKAKGECELQPMDVLCMIPCQPLLICPKKHNHLWHPQAFEVYVSEIMRFSKFDCFHSVLLYSRYPLCLHPVSSAHTATLVDSFLGWLWLFASTNAADVHKFSPVFEELFSQQGPRDRCD